MIERTAKDSSPRYELYFLSEVPDTEFLFAKPLLPYSLAALRERNVHYIFVVRLRPGFQPDFYRELESSAKLVKHFTPYRDPFRKWPVSFRPLTGAPFLGSDLLARRQNGPIIDLYELQ